MTDVAKEIRIDWRKPVVCAGGFVLRQREWAERGDECLEKHCPHPDTCEIKHRAKKEKESS